MCTEQTTETAAMVVEVTAEVATAVTALVAAAMVAAAMVAEATVLAEKAMPTAGERVRLRVAATVVEGEGLGRGSGCLRPAALHSGQPRSSSAELAPRSSRSKL